MEQDNMDADYWKNLYYTLRNDTDRDYRKVCAELDDAVSTVEKQREREKELTESLNRESEAKQESRKIIRELIQERDMAREARDTARKELESRPSFAQAVEHTRLQHELKVAQEEVDVLQAQLETAKGELEIAQAEAEGANRRLDDLIPGTSGRTKRLSDAERDELQELRKRSGELVREINNNALVIERLRASVDTHQARRTELAGELSQKKREVVQLRLVECEREEEEEEEEVEHETTLALDKAAEIVCGDRAETYGLPSVNHARTARMWAAYLGLDPELLDARDVCHMNSLQKISRDRHLRKDDTVVDLAGYAQNASWVGDPRGGWNLDELVEALESGDEEE